MPFLTLGAEKHELRIGANILGGRDADAVTLAPLSALEAAARIVAEASGAAVIERVSVDAQVTVDGEALGEGALPLRHGTRIAVGSCAMTYGAPRGGGKERPAAPAPRRAPARPTEVVPIFASPAEAGRIVEVATARTFYLPMSGAVIGRELTSDVVVTGPGVSRRHAVIRPGAEGFTITDESTNGTFVNGERAQPGQLLAHGDLLRVGANEFRFETHAARAKADPVARAVTEVQPALAAPEAESEAAAAGALGSLRVTRGSLRGRVFHLERPVCAIGRADHNDVCITDGSVSSSHATLLFKAGTWYLVDLRSANGTYVEGYRVGGERALHGPCTIRVGTVKMEFRPRSGGAARAEAPRRLSLLQRIAALW